MTKNQKPNNTTFYYNYISVEEFLKKNKKNKGWSDDKAASTYNQKKLTWSFGATTLNLEITKNMDIQMNCKKEGSLKQEKVLEKINK